MTPMQVLGLVAAIIVILFIILLVILYLTKDSLDEGDSLIKKGAMKIWECCIGRKNG